MVIFIYICIFYFYTYNVIKGDKPFYPIGKLLKTQDFLEGCETFYTSKILIMTILILVDVKQFILQDLFFRS